MLRPSRSIVLPFEIKKASLALWIESLLEKMFSVGINCMSLAVFPGGSVVRRGKEMFCECSIGLDLMLGLSMVGGVHYIGLLNIV